MARKFVLNWSATPGGEAASPWRFTVRHSVFVGRIRADDRGIR
jgi:hypothetical protein